MPFGITSGSPAPVTGYGERFSLGETTGPRSELLAPATALAASSQQLRLTFFTAAVSEPITSVALWSGGQAAGATPSLIRIGIYSVDSNDDGSLIASTANDTTLLAAQNTRYAKALQATWSKTAGTRYAIGLLFVTAAAVPHTTGWSQGGQQAISDRAPRTAGLLAAQADLPNNFTSAGLSASGLHTFYELLR